MIKNCITCLHIDTYWNEEKNSWESFCINDNCTVNHIEQTHTYCCCCINDQWEISKEYKKWAISKYHITDFLEVDEILI